MSQRIKVLNVIIEDRIGGPQLRILQVAKRLREKGVETIVAIPRNNGDFQERLRTDNVKFYEIENFRRPRFTLNPAEHIKYIFSFLPSVVKLRSIVEAESIDIVHQNDIRQIQGPIAAKLARKKVLWHLQGKYPIISSLFIPFPYYLADLIVTASNATGKSYFKGKGRLFSRTFQTLYAPVDTAKFHPEVEGKSFRREFGLTGVYPVIGTVANINPIKGHIYFAHAARLIKQKYGGARFVIVGKILENRIDYMNKLRRLLERLGFSREDFIFTGERSDVAEALAAFDVFVLPSLFEACPMALLEAMAMERPSVASNIGGVPEIIKNGETGFLVRPKDPKEIARAVDDLLTRPDEARRMAARGRKHIVANFDLEACAENHYTLYCDLLK
jgi:glycosyltransferase involved in cell wall biosynthesis